MEDIPMCFSLDYWTRWQLPCTYVCVILLEQWKMKKEMSAWPNQNILLCIQDVSIETSPIASQKLQLPRIPTFHQSQISISQMLSNSETPSIYLQTKRTVFLNLIGLVTPVFWVSQFRFKSAMHRWFSCFCSHRSHRDCGLSHTDWVECDQ